MRVIVGTANLSKRPNAIALRGTGAKLTEAMVRRAMEAHQDPAPVDLRPALLNKRRKPEKNAKIRPPFDPRNDPLAWAKASALMRNWTSAQ